MPNLPFGPTALVTGASIGIGATYADRLAERGYDLVLVARNAGQLEGLAARLRAEKKVQVDVLQADLTQPADLAKVEQRLREDARINLLVNNAGMATPGGFAAPDLDQQEQLIRLNVLAPTRLAGAIVPRLLAQGSGAIVNIASILALAPEFMPGAYPATKSFILTFSQGLNQELGGKGLYVQAVMPAATRTEIWARSGRDPAAIAGMMDVDLLVDAALSGFDKREQVTLPTLHDESLWDSFDAARKAMLPHFRQELPAPRYRA